MGIYVLGKKQEKAYKEFRKIGIDNLGKIAIEIENFVRAIQEKAGRDKAIIGLSGGVDSALTVALISRAIGPENVLAVKMPYCGVTSRKSAMYADMVAKNFGLKSENIMEIPINKAVDAIIKVFDASAIRLDGIRTGNVMSRVRMNILYAIAGAKNGLVVDTCNKTELLLGYFTRYGDGASDYNPVGSLYKTWVWELAKYLGVPKKVVDRTPTAELALGKSDEKDLGISYPAIDLLLWLSYEQKVSEEELVKDYYYPRRIMEMVRKRTEANRFKSEIAPICEIKI